MPVKNPVVTSPYGMRTLKEKKQFHKGIDLVSKNDRGVHLAEAGAYAAADGKIWYDMDMYDEALRWKDKAHSAGNYVGQSIFIEGKKYYVRYLHLRINYVMIGEMVKAGRLIGIYANAGESYGAHLHFDMFDENWESVNPTRFFVD